MLLCTRCRGAWSRMLDPANRGQAWDRARPAEPPRAASIPVLYAELNVRHGSSPDGTAARGVFRSTPPGDVDRMALRDPRSRPAEQGDAWSVPATLRRLVAACDRRDIHGHAERKPRAGAHPVELARWLHARLDWLAGQDWAPAVDDALRTLWGQLRAATGDPSPRPVGSCRQLVDGDGRLIREGWEPPDLGVDEAGQPVYAGPWRCAEPLYLPAQAPRAMDEPVQLPGLRCRACGWSYTPLELVRLGRERERAATA